MIGYELPTSLSIRGVEYAIRTDFRAILDVLMAMNDPDLDNEAKGIVLLTIMYPDIEQIPHEDLTEAYTKACEFIDCGQKDDGKNHPKTIDWEQDSGIIVPAVNSVAHVDIRTLPYLHWWSFFGYFMEIRESLLSTVVNIRQKKAKHKKLDKWEEEFYRDNKALVDFTHKESEEDKEIKANMMKWL